MSKKYLCPVCGLNELKEEPFNKKNVPSYEICSCCGFEFGFNGENNKKCFSEYRNRWIAEGFTWFMVDLKPKNWDYRKQIENLNKH